MHSKGLTLLNKLYQTIAVHASVLNTIALRHKSLNHAQAIASVCLLVSVPKNEFGIRCFCVAS